MVIIECLKLLLHENCSASVFVVPIFCMWPHVLVYLIVMGHSSGCNTRTHYECETNNILNNVIIFISLNCGCIQQAAV
jgi:hypothetical protein